MECIVEKSFQEAEEEEDDDDKERVFDRAKCVTCTSC